MKAVRRVVFRRQKDHQHVPLISSLDQNMSFQSIDANYNHNEKPNSSSKQKTKSPSTKKSHHNDDDRMSSSPLQFKQPLHHDELLSSSQASPSNDHNKNNMMLSVLCQKTSPSEKTITTTASSAYLNEDTHQEVDGSMSGDEYFEAEHEDEPNYVHDTTMPGNMRLRKSTSRLPSMHSSQDAQSYGLKQSTKSSTLDTSYASTASENSSSSRAIKRREARAEQAQKIAIRDRDQWKKKLTQSVVMYGSSSIQTANCLLDLGAAHMTCKEYSEALSAFKKSVRIIRKQYGNNSLQIARALDCVGTAACKFSEQRQCGLISLNEALHIRFKHLGSDHVDTVDTLNNMAGCYVHMRKFKEAKEAYEEILYLRSCIFGRNHASVAVTAELLGNVNYKLREWESAIELYDFAMDVLTGPGMELKPDHPMVIKLQKEIQKVERIIDIEA